MLPGWTRAEIAGKAADVFHPPGVVSPRFAILFLHAVGLESLTENVAYSTELSRYGLACCAPQGARSWWADRICPEFDPQFTAERHLLDQVLPWMQAHWRPTGLAAIGISMGGQGAVRLGFKHPDRFGVVASVSGAFEYDRWYGRGSPIDEMYDSPEQCRQDTAILHVNPHLNLPMIWIACDPDDDEWYRGNDRLHEKLTALGISHTADLETRAGGHSWSYFNAMADPLFEFVVHGLERRSRRLV